MASFSTLGTGSGVSGVSAKKFWGTESSYGSVAMLVAASNFERGTRRGSDFPAQVFEPQHRIIEPVSAEIFSSRVLQALGIGCPTQFIVADANEAYSADEAKWVVKAFKDGNRLRWWDGEAGDRNLLIGRIPNTCTLHDLQYVHDLDFRGIVGWPEELTAPERPHPVDTGFVLPNDTTKILDALSFKSLPLMKLHAARVFLNTSCGHRRNILINPSGDLFSIDHENVMFSDGWELALLFEHVKKNTTAFEACGAVANLNAAALDSCFKDLAYANFPLGLARTRDYLQGRLDYWKKLYNIVHSN